MLLTFANSLGPDQDSDFVIPERDPNRLNVGPDQNTKRLTLLVSERNI